MARKSGVRKQYFIKRGFQYNFIFKFCCVVIIGSLLSTLILFYISQDTLTSSFHNSRLVVRSTAETILPAVAATNLITLCLVTFATFFVTMFVSHKIAGPLYRLEVGMASISKGNLTERINFRKKDQVTVMADNFNAMAESLCANIGELQSEVELLKELAENDVSKEEIVRGLEGFQKLIGDKFII